MIRRPRRTVPATIVGLVLLVATVCVAISCIQLIAGRAPLLPFAALGNLGRDATWNHPAILAGGTVLALIGLVLLACAALPGTPRILALAHDSGRTDAGVTRSSLVRDLTARAGRADGVSGARVKVGARAVRVRARTPLRDHSGLAEQIRSVLAERLDDLHLARRPRLRVTLTPDRSVR